MGDVGKTARTRREDYMELSPVRVEAFPCVCLGGFTRVAGIVGTFRTLDSRVGTLIRSPISPTSFRFALTCWPLPQCSSWPICIANIWSQTGSLLAWRFLWWSRTLLDHNLRNRCSSGTCCSPRLLQILPGVPARRRRAQRRTCRAAWRRRRTGGCGSGFAVSPVYNRTAQW